MPGPSNEKIVIGVHCLACGDFIETTNLDKNHQKIVERYLKFTPDRTCPICYFNDADEQNRSIYSTVAKFLLHLKESRRVHKELLLARFANVMLDPEDDGLRNVLELLKEHVVSCAAKIERCQNIGCCEILAANRLSEHKEACEFSREVCHQCGNSFRCSEMPAHATSCASKQKLVPEKRFKVHQEECKYCEKLIPPSEMQSHLNVCDEAEAQCGTCGGLFTSKLYLLFHQSTTVDCLVFHQPTPCYICEPPRTVATGQKFKKFYPTEDELRQHLGDPETSAVHIQLLAERLEYLESKYEAKDQQPLENLKLYARQRTEPLLSTVAETVLQMKSIEVDVDSAMKKADTLVDSMREVHKAEELTASLTSELELKERSGLEQVEMISQLKALVENLKKRCIAMDKRVRDIELSTSNGELVWKIKDYRKLKLDAQTGRTVSLNSHPFYSSEGGYKMCCEVYLNGHGVGCGNCLSVFFVLMKGEYDALLSWPFKEKITFQLFCPSNRSRDQKETFMPDESTSFQKPQNEMNRAIGFPQFLQQSQLEDPSNGYLVNDCIYIGITVGDKSM